MKKQKLHLMLGTVIELVALLTLSYPAIASVTSDNRIESAAKNSNVFKTYLKNDSVSINSKNGVVTLTGTVSDQSHKMLAENTVENLPGVKKVHNELATNTQQANANADGWIGTKVKTTLLFHRNVDALKTQVDVKDGVVTLQGEANSQAQKDLTTEYAKDIDGVKDVDNQLKVVASTVKPAETMGEKIDDASITAQVKMVLLYHRSTSALATTVKTDNGVVQLGGRAHNSAEKDLVTKLVSNVNGVNDVVNHMTIDPETKG